MISQAQRTPRPAAPGPNRWKSLSPQQQRAEFRELEQSPYWYFIPDEIKFRIKDLIND